MLICLPSLAAVGRDVRGDAARERSVFAMRFAAGAISAHSTRRRARMPEADALAMRSGGVQHVRHRDGSGRWTGRRPGTDGFALRGEVCRGVRRAESGPSDATANRERSRIRNRCLVGRVHGRSSGQAITAPESG